MDSITTAHIYVTVRSSKLIGSPWIYKAHGEHESVKDLKAMEARYLSYRLGFVENQCMFSNYSDCQLKT